VIVTSVSDAEARAARELGADATVNHGDDDVAAA
jgi:NADPH:quinone reductase-like Zn-dependent oxidoreductase